jgi:hypothetical protein
LQFSHHLLDFVGSIVRDWIVGVRAGCPPLALRN